MAVQVCETTGGNQWIYIDFNEGQYRKFRSSELRIAGMSGAWNSPDRECFRRQRLWQANDRGGYVSSQMANDTIATGEKVDEGDSLTLV